MNHFRTIGIDILYSNNQNNSMLFKDNRAGPNDYRQQFEDMLGMNAKFAEPEKRMEPSKMY